MNDSRATEARVGDSARVVSREAVGERRDAFTRLLLSVAVAANESSDAREAIATAIREVCSRLGWPVGHAFVERDGAFVSTDLWHLDDPETFAGLRERTEGLSFPRGTGMVGRAAEGRPVWVPDVLEDPEFVHRGSEMGVRSGYAFPVLAGDEVTGVLEFFSDRIEEPGDDLLEVMASVGTQIGRAIERARAERRLEASERRFRRLVETAYEGIWLYDPDGGITTWVNDRMAEMMGYAPEEMIGRSAFEFMDEEVKEEALERIRRRASGISEQYEFRFRKKSGETLWVLMHSSPLMDETGEFEEGLVMVTDITDRIEAEQKVHALNDELEQRVKRRTAALAATNAELEAFAYSVSHDLRAPLRIVDGYGQALLEDFGEELDDEGRHYLERIRHNTQKMGSLIDDLLTLSRITRSAIDRELVDLSHLAREVAGQLRHLEPDREVDVVIRDDVEATADRSMMRVVLENLLGNAWKYTRESPRARIEFGDFDDEEEGDRVFFVRDDGAGFDPRFAEKLFVPFQRLHSDTRFEGNGIGLATVRRIVARHGGRVWAEGEVGRGATFYFTLE